MPSTNKLSQQTIEQTKVIQEVLSSEVSKLSHAVLNKKQGDQIQFSPEKRLKMDSSPLSNPHTGRWIVL